mgnify:CR=1 FL=1
MAIVGLVPAAGYATRLAGSIDGSKEVQIVRGRPVMRYVVDRMRAGGATSIRIVTRRDKRDVIDLAVEIGADVTLGRPTTVSASLILASRGLADRDIGLFGFPDTVWTPADGFVPLVRLVDEGEPLALGLFDSPYPERSDVAILDDEGRLLRVEIKPSRPSGSLVWAAGAVRIGTLRTILRDVEPGDAFNAMAQRVPIAAVRLGRVIDIGTPPSLLEASDDPVFAP